MDTSKNLYVHIEPDVKEQAETILSGLGIPVSYAITMFYQQIILHNGLPFDVKLPKHPLDLRQVTSAQLDAELEKGYTEMQTEHTLPAKEAFAQIRKENSV